MLIVGGTFLLTLAPWIWRNIAVSGTPFGTAGYAIVEGTYVLPENKLQRALEPNFKGLGVKPFLFPTTRGRSSRMNCPN